MNYDFNIVTIHKAENYGAVLQAYALKTYLCALGYTTGIYDAKQIPAEANRSLRSKLISFTVSAFGLLNKKRFSEKTAKFRKFADSNFDINMSYDAKAYIAGSDQIWNPIVFNPDYYLEFAPDSAVKVSYAASIGISELPDSLSEKYRHYLSKFDFLSVRETSAKAALQKFLPEKDIRVDLDPSFLLTKQQWEKLARNGENTINGDYILLYILHIPENINLLCKWLKKELNAKLVLIDTSGYLSLKIKHDIAIKNAGPEDFLALMKDAKAVITTSFHGTAFSVLFEKEFYSVINPAFPSRVQNIMSYLEIKSVSNTQNNFVRNSIDFQHIREKIDQGRKNSEQYFKSIMESCVKRNEQ